MGSTNEIKKEADEATNLNVIICGYNFENFSYKLYIFGFIENPY